MNCLTHWFRRKPRPLDNDDYTAAGAIFTDGNLVLAGYQTHKHCISGIGGKKEQGETYIDTALRETLEELFELSSIPQALLTELKKTLLPIQVVYSGKYRNVQYSFDDLITILQLLSKHSIQSPLYTTIPKDLQELLLHRKFHAANAEISHLCILPLIHKRLPIVQADFLQDVQSIYKGSV